MDTYLYYGDTATNSSNIVSGRVNLYGGSQDSGIRIRVHITSSGSLVTAQLQVYCTSTNVWRYLWNKAWLKIDGVTLFSWVDGDTNNNPHGFGAGGSPAQYATTIAATTWVNWPVNQYWTGAPTGASATTGSTFTLQVMIGDTYFNAGDVTWTSNVLTLTNDTADGWKTATPYVYDGGSWKQATPYVYDGGSWKQATTYVKG